MALNIYGLIRSYVQDDGKNKKVEVKKPFDETNGG